MNERQYDQIEVDTVDEADTFMPGMRVLLGDDEWIVESINRVGFSHFITVVRDYGTTD